jgi:hypothetical protein
LRDGQELDVVLDSTTWPTEPTQFAVLGTASVDGQEIAFQEVSQLLKVFRVGGDESIVVRFLATLQARRALIERRNAWLESKTDQLQKQIDEFRRDVSGFSIASWDELIDTLNETTTQRTLAVANTARLHEQIAKLEELDRKQEALQIIGEQGPDLDRQVRDLDDQIRIIDDQRVTLQDRQRLLRPGADATRALIDQLESLNKRRNEEKEQDVVDRANAESAAANLGTTADHDELNKLRYDMEAKRHRLITHRAELDLTPDLISLVRSIRTPLIEAEGSSLDNETVAILWQREVPAREMRIGLELQLRELTTKSDTEQLSQLSNQIDLLAHRLTEIAEAKRLLTVANTTSNKLIRTEQEIQHVLRALDPSGEEEYQIVTRQLQNLEEQKLALVEERVITQVRRRTLDAEGDISFLQQRIRTLTDELDIHDSLHVELTMKTSEAKLIADEVREADQRLAELRLAMADYESRLSEAISMVSENVEYAWLRQIACDYVPTALMDRRQCVMLLESLDNAAAALSNSLDELARRTDHMLSDPEIQSALFNDGHFTAISLIDREVSWTDSAGEVQRRPIEAFSSGELAFAYVLTSILQRASESARNRVLVLDEFGAFIAAGRLGRLRRFLHERVLNEGIAEQVVIIMPLREPILVEGVKPIAQLNAEVQARGYFCQGISL